MGTNRIIELWKHTHEATDYVEGFYQLIIGDVSYIFDTDDTIFCYQEDISANVTHEFNWNIATSDKKIYEDDEIRYIKERLCHLSFKNEYSGEIIIPETGLTLTFYSGKLIEVKLNQWYVSIGSLGIVIETHISRDNWLADTDDLDRVLQIVKELIDES